MTIIVNSLQDDIVKRNKQSGLEGFKPFIYSYLFGDGSFIKAIPFNEEQLERLRLVGIKKKEAEEF